MLVRIKDDNHLAECVDNEFNRKTDEDIVRVRFLEPEKLPKHWLKESEKIQGNEYPYDPYIYHIKKKDLEVMFSI